MIGAALRYFKCSVAQKWFVQIKAADSFGSETRAFHDLPLRATRQWLLIWERRHERSGAQTPIPCHLGNGFNILREGNRGCSLSASEISLIDCLTVPAVLQISPRNRLPALMNVLLAWRKAGPCFHASGTSRSLLQQGKKETGPLVDFCFRPDTPAMTMDYARHDR